MSLRTGYYLVASCEMVSATLSPEKASAELDVLAEFGVASKEGSEGYTFFKLTTKTSKEPFTIEFTDATHTKSTKVHINFPQETKDTLSCTESHEQ